MHNIHTTRRRGGIARAKYISITAVLFLWCIIGPGCGVITHTVKLYPITTETPSVKTGHGENILVSMAEDNRADDKNMNHPQSFIFSPCFNDDGDNFGDIGQFGHTTQSYHTVLLFEEDQDLPKTVSVAVVDTLKTYGYNASLLDVRYTGRTDGPMLKVLYPSVERLNCVYGAAAVLGFSLKQPGDGRVLWSGSVVNRTQFSHAYFSTLANVENILNLALQGAIKEFGEQTGTPGFRNALIYDKNARMVNEGKP